MHWKSFVKKHKVANDAHDVEKAAKKNVLLSSITREKCHKLRNHKKGTELFPENAMEAGKKEFRTKKQKA
jgi:hypothetical protein